METLTVFGELLKPWIYAVLLKTATTPTWTGLSERTHLWAQSRILSQPKRSREKTPRVGSQVISSTLCRKRKLLAQSWRNLLLTVNNRSIANCVRRPRLLYVRAMRFTSADHLTQISRGSLNAFGPFLSSRIKRRLFLKRWTRAMTTSRALMHQRLNWSPSCLFLTLCRSSLHLRGPHFVSTFHALTPHIKWAGDPGGNGFDISQKAWYKQSNCMRWNSSAPAEGNRWPDRTVPDHVTKQILAAPHFPGRLETPEYCTHF